MKHFNSVGLKTKKPTNKFISWLFAEAGGFEYVGVRWRDRKAFFVGRTMDRNLTGKTGGPGY